MRIGQVRVLISEFKCRLGITKSLHRGTAIKVKGYKIWLDFRYERLPNFCFKCVIIKHGEFGCPKFLVSRSTHDGNNNQYGIWLLAPSQKSNSMKTRFNNDGQSSKETKQTFLHIRDDEVEGDKVDYGSFSNKETNVSECSTLTENKPRSVDNHGLVNGNNISYANKERIKDIVKSCPMVNDFANNQEAKFEEVQMATMNTKDPQQVQEYVIAKKSHLPIYAVDVLLKSNQKGKWNVVTFHMSIQQ